MQKIKLMVFCLLVLSFMACSNEESKKGKTSIEKTEEKEMTIRGTAEKIDFGKDGYSVTLKVEDGKTYEALLSIVNLGGPDKYQTMNVGDKASLKGGLDVRAGVNYMKVSEIISIEKMVTDLTIKNNSFSNISPGETIGNYPEVLKKDVLKNGEGTFNIFRIINEGSNITAYCLPDTRNEKLVGNIYIVSKGARTEDGIEVGNSYSDLLAKYPNIAVHGSEVEGRTYAKHNNLSYRLDVANFSYEVDKSKIPKATEITEIIINKKSSSAE